MDTVGRHVEADLDQSIKRKEEDAAERHTVAARRNDGTVLKGSGKNLIEHMHKHFGWKQNSFSCFFSITYTKDDLGKPGSDAGMPGIEDSEVGKIEDAQFGEYHKVNNQKI